MKRLHVSFSVKNLEESIRFYSAMFGAQPTVAKDDYAKWMLEDPKVNFVIEERGDPLGFTHAGIQVESEDELKEVYGRFEDAEGPILEVGETTCCYAKSDKNWTLDPQGVPWEAFFTHHLTEEFGTSDPLEDLATAQEQSKKAKKPSVGACC